MALLQPPSHEGSAAARCAVGLLKGLIAHGVEVTAIAARRAWTSDDVPPGLPVEVIEPAPERPAARSARLRRPRADLTDGAFARRVAAEAATGDILHLEQTETAWCGENVEIPKLVHLHYLVGLDRGIALPWTRTGRDTLELKLLERMVVSRFDHLTASSARVAAHLRRRSPSATVRVTPLSLDPGHYGRSELTRPAAGFIGTASWPPTKRAALTLLRDVWPRVVKLAPRSRLVIAGRGMDGLQDPGVQGVDVLGEVASAAAFAEDLGLMLFPLFGGSGMKVKVIEAMASGVPVVTTSEGAEGIAPNEGVIVADDLRSMATAAAGLLTDQKERLERGAAAHRAFMQHYEPRVATAPLVDLYRSMAGSS